MNDRAALELLAAHGPLTRTRLGELTGLSKPTASQLLTRLESVGLVRTTGNVTGRPGPNAQLYEIDPAAAHVAALAVDQEGITAAVADITGQVAGEHRVTAPATDESLTNRTGELVAEAVDGALAAAGLGRDDLHSTVIGTPGALTRAPGRCATPRICPAGSPAPCGTSWPRCCTPRSSSRTTSTSPPSPNSTTAPPRTSTTSRWSGPLRCPCPTTGPKPTAGAISPAPWSASRTPAPTRTPPGSW
ncbi:hypothetical protein SANTM175S_07240 [Streptomyces antimycoticus]